MHSKLDIPRKAIYRLSIYHRCLDKLKENGIETVSSQALAKAAGVKPTQLRKDLAYFGQLGTRGLGYNVETVSGFIAEALGRSKFQPVILVGVGNLGTALLRYKGFNKEGFEVLGAFDIDESSRTIDGRDMKVRCYEDMPEFVENNEVKMAILAVPANVAQLISNELVQAGVQAILNFSPTVLQVPDSVVVNNVDLALELENLSYFIR